MTNTTDIQGFKKELKALLEKYSASICFEVGDASDTHGLYDEAMVIVFKDTELRFDGWSIEKNDLKQS